MPLKDHEQLAAELKRANARLAESLKRCRAILAEGRSKLAGNEVGKDRGGDRPAFGWQEGRDSPAPSGDRAKPGVD